LKLVCISLLIGVSIAAATADEVSSIGYRTVQIAFDDLKDKDGVEISVQGGWTIIQDEGNENLVLWSFTRGSHPAHPAAIKRQIIQRDGRYFIKMDALCQAEKAACDQLMSEFEQLNQRIVASGGVGS